LGHAGGDVIKEEDYVYIRSIGLGMVFLS
jgi:hypothetical protein